MENTTKKYWLQIGLPMVSVIEGMLAGYMYGLIIAASFVVIFAAVTQANLSGENSLVIALFAFFYGAPFGVVVGGIFGFLTRHIKWCRWISIVGAVLYMLYCLNLFVSGFGFFPPLYVPFLNINLI
jgi:hypothetical protein